MMTIPSIDMMTTPLDAVAAGESPSLAAAMPVALDSPALPRFGQTTDSSTSGGLLGLVEDNAALGEALRSLIEAFDVPKTEKPVVEPDRAVLASVGNSAVADSPSVTDSTVADAPSVADSTVADAPIRGDVLVPLSSENREAISSDIPEAISSVARDPVVPAEFASVLTDKPVVAVVPPTSAEPMPAAPMSAEPMSPAPMSAEPMPAEAMSAAPKLERVDVEPMPVVDVAETKTETVAETPESVVLQAASVVAAPIADVSETPVEATEATAVAPVSRVAPVDVSALFISAAEAVAAAVTVSPELMRGEAGEIRIQLRPDVLEGSEVVVSVDGKKMDVTFVPVATHVADTIVSNTTVLQSQLETRIAGFDISVAVAQTVATNVANHVGSSQAAQMAVNRARRTNGRA